MLELIKKAQGRKIRLRRRYEGLYSSVATRLECARCPQRGRHALTRLPDLGYFALPANRRVWCSFVRELLTWRASACLVLVMPSSFWSASVRQRPSSSRCRPSPVIVLISLARPQILFRHAYAAIIHHNPRDSSLSGVAIEDTASK